MYKEGWREGEEREVKEGGKDGCQVDVIRRGLRSSSTRKAETVI